MKRDRISVIVPCYNAEKFLDDCFASLRGQTYQNFEVIFINDGSTDGTLQKLKELQEIAGSGQVKILDQQNGGVSSARNRGLSEAEGEFVLFLDADDFYVSQAFECMIENIKKFNADSFRFRLKWTTDKEKFKPTKLEKFKVKMLSGQDDMQCHLFAGRIGFGSSSKLYRHEVLKKMDGYPRVFDEEIYYGEDTDFYSRYLLKSNNVAVSDVKLYVYRKHQGSLVRSKMNNKKLTMFKSFERAKKLDRTVYKNTYNYVSCRESEIALEFLFKIDTKDFHDKNAIQKLYKSYRENLKYLHKCKLAPWYLKGNFNYMFIPFFRFKFRKFLK